MQYESPTSSDKKVMAKVKDFVYAANANAGADFKVKVTGNTHVQYESPTFSGLKVIAKVKVFVYAANANAGAEANTDTRAMT